MSRSDAKALKQPDQARDILVRALSYPPTHAVAHYNLALLFEEDGELGKAYDHYLDFLKYAGPEHGTLLSDMRRRVDVIHPRLDIPLP